MKYVIEYKTEDDVIRRGRVELEIPSSDLSQEEYIKRLKKLILVLDDINSALSDDDIDVERRIENGDIR